MQLCQGFLPSPDKGDALRLCNLRAPFTKIIDYWVTSYMVGNLVFKLAGALG